MNTITCNKKIVPTYGNFYKSENGFWIHKDAARKLCGNALVAYKQHLVLTAVQDEILIGTLLGDGYITFPKNLVTTYHARFCQKLSAADYVDHLYQTFKPFVGTPPRMRKIGGIKAGLPMRYDVRFRTYAHTEFKYYYDLFYPGQPGHVRPKRVPKNIGDLLTARSLAYWFMDDGTTKVGAAAKGYVFSTQGFCYADQLILQKALKNTFGLHASIHKDKTYFKLALKACSAQGFHGLIKPYMHPYFYYKL